MAYLCSTCGQPHDEVPLSFAADFPDNYANLSADAREIRAVIGSDQCVIDSEEFYIRGLLEIPIHASEQKFFWGLWALVKEAVYDEISDCWEQDGREKQHGPFKGRIANSLAEYPETANLKISIVIQPIGVRPLFFVHEEDHPLAIAQSKGMTEVETYSLVSRLLHPTPHSRTMM